MVGGCAALFNCTPVGRATGSVVASACSFWLDGAGAFVCYLVRRGSAGCLLLLQIFSGVVWQTGGLSPSYSALCLSGPRLCFFIVILLDLSVGRGVRWRVGGGRAGRAAGWVFVPHQLRRVRLRP